MDILIIGDGGREDALAHTLGKDPRVEKIYMTGSSGAQRPKVDLVDLSVDDLEGLRRFAQDKKVDLTIVGPELPLNLGIVDEFKNYQLKIFGPDKKSAYLEGSKDFAKEFMLEYDVATAGYQRFTDYEKAVENIGLYGFPQVIKADGLCAGKGVYICQNEREAREALREIFLEDRFGNQAAKIIVEEFIDGPEVSLLCFVAGDKIYPMETAMDYKKIGDGDKGPNTGGVGCLSPNPYWNKKLEDQSDQLIKNIERGLKDRGLGYSGILFIGYIIDGDQLKVLEFNTRFGDPETEVLLPRLRSRLLDHILASIDHRPIEMDWEKNLSLALILSSKGYPLSYEKGFEIGCLDRLDQDILVFHNGTRIKDQRLVTDGGRVLSLVAKGDTWTSIREKVYGQVKNIDCNKLIYRKDIGLLD